jgi:hypothetical protein
VTSGVRIADASFLAGQRSQALPLVDQIFRRSTIPGRRRRLYPRGVQFWAASLPAEMILCRDDPEGYGEAVPRILPEAGSWRAPARKGFPFLAPR